MPHGFVAGDDAASGQQLLHHTKTERDAKIQPHRMADDLGGEPIPGVAGASTCRHPIRLLTPMRCVRASAAGSTKSMVPIRAAEPGSQARIACSSGATPKIAITRFRL